MEVNLLLSGILSGIVPKPTVNKPLCDYAHSLAWLSGNLELDEMRTKLMQMTSV